MERNIVATPKAPAAIGPYSQAVIADKTVYCSGQIPLDPASGEIVGSDVASQTTQVMKNLAAVLEAAGADFSSVIKCTIYLQNMNEFGTVNEIYGSYFSAPFPARVTIEAAVLPKKVLVEIDAIAKVL
jgi:2-iminobutanoate/2-iminopropanoate deaminase